MTLQCTREMVERALADEPFEGLERWLMLDALTAQEMQDRITAALEELELADACLLGKPGAGEAMASHRRLAAILTNEKAPLERGRDQERTCA